MRIALTYLGTYPVSCLDLELFCYPLVGTILEALVWDDLIPFMSFQVNILAPPLLIKDVFNTYLTTSRL